MTKMVPIHTIVKPYGRVAAIGLVQGERYYWLIDKHGTISMMPAIEIERRHQGRGKAHRTAQTNRPGPITSSL